MDESKPATEPPAVEPHVVVNNVVAAPPPGSTRRWVIACALFLVGGLFAGSQCGYRMGKESGAPKPSASSKPAPTADQDQRLRRIEERLDTVERKALAYDQLSELTVAVHSHTHRTGDQAVLTPPKPGARTDLVPVPAPTAKGKNPSRSDTF